MKLASIVGAPQLTRLLRELPEARLRDLLAHDAFSKRITSHPVPLEGNEWRFSTRSLLAELPKDDRSVLEREALRIVRLDTARADALHIRISGGHDFDCRPRTRGRGGPTCARSLVLCSSSVLVPAC